MGYVSATTPISKFDKKIQKVINKDVNPKVKPAPFLHVHLLEAGVDEAGRGCLAGPVFAAAVILPKDFKNDILTDSKMMTEKNRNKLRNIIQAEALAFGVAYATEAEIDEHNIANASYIAMNRAIKLLGKVPEMLLIDGKYYKPYDLEIPFNCIIKGDLNLQRLQRHRF